MKQQHRSAGLGKLVLAILAMFAFTLVLVLVFPAVMAFNTSNILAYYSFDNNSGTVVQDISGNGNNLIRGSLAPYWPGKLNNGTNQSAVSTNSFINGTMLIANTTNISICYWVNFTSAITSRNHIHVNLMGNSNTQDTFRAILYNNGLFQFTNDYNLAGGQVNLTTFANSWVFICGTLNQTEGDTYINAVLKLNDTAILQRAPTKKLFIGSSDIDASVNDGIIDELMIYGEVLTASEISTLYTNYTQGHNPYYADSPANVAPVFTQEVPDISIFVNQTMGVQANCTDADNASLIWIINSTLFTINQTGYFNDSSHTNVSIGNWSVRVNCSDGALSAISDFSYEIKNTTNTPPPPENSIPTISVDVRPNSATNETDLYCYVTVTDADNATTLVEYNWYNGTTLYGGEIDLLVTTGIETLMNITRYANLGVGDVWNCTAYAWDGINASAWASDTVTIAEPSILGEGAFMGYAAIAILMGAVLYVLLKIGLNLVDEHFPLKIFLIWVSVLLLIPLSQLAIHMMSSMDSTIISMLTILQYAITIVGIMTTLYMMIKMLQYYLSTFGKKTKNPLRT